MSSYSANDETELMAALWSPEIKDDLERFVMFAYPWGEKDTPLENMQGPRKWQRKILARVTKFIAENKNDPAAMSKALRLAVVSGRGVGKSVVVAWLIDWMISTRIGSTVIVSANNENQLRKVTWGELTKWLTMSINSHWWEITATAVLPTKWLSEAVQRDLKKGTRYWGAEGKLWSEENPDGYAGAHNMDGMMVIFDEASGIPDGIWSVAEGFFTENIPDRYWLAFSNGRRNTGAFYDIFNGKKGLFWGSEKVNALEVEGTDKQVYQSIIDEYGEDSDTAKVEVYGEFPSTGENQFITQRLADNAFERENELDTSAPIVVGVDPAREGGDEVGIVVRQGRSVIKAESFKQPDTMVTVGRIIDVIREYNPDMVAIDQGGLGGGIVDRLRELGFQIEGVNFGWSSSKKQMWANKRAEMWGNMREWLKEGSLPKNDKMRIGLTSPRMTYNSTGAVLLESKKSMKSRGATSPDIADALALTFATELANIVSQKLSKTREVGYNRPTKQHWMAL